MVRSWGTTWSTLLTLALWLLLAWPAWPLVADFWHNNRYYPELMHESGLFSVQLLVATLLVTPVNFLLKFNKAGVVIARWLLKRRRNLGVASFCYAFLHLLFYIREVADIELVLLEAIDLELAVGWVAFLIFVVLTATSNDWSVRQLLLSWKRLHLWVYPATAMTFLHWLLLDSFPDLALSWLIPLLVTRALHLYVQRR